MRLRIITEAMRKQAADILIAVAAYAVILLSTLLTAIAVASTWSAWNGITVGGSGGNVSKWQGITIGTSSGNIGAWNGLVSPSGSSPPALTFHTLSNSTDGKVALTSALDSSGTTSIAIVASWAVTGTPGTLIDWTNTCGNSTTTCNTWLSGSVYGDTPSHYGDIQIYYCLNCTVGPGHIFKFDFGSVTVDPSIAAMGFTVVSHFQAGSDVGILGPTSGTTTTSPTQSPGQVNSVIITGCSSSQPLFAASPSVSSPFTTVDGQDYQINNSGIGSGYYVGGTAQTATWDQHGPGGEVLHVAGIILY